MPKIDLYKVFQLDPRQSPEELAAQLDRQIAATDPANRQLRQQITTTRTILGDSRRRAEYDRALADPGARIAADDIDRIAGRSRRLTPTQRALAIVAAVTAILLIVSVGLVVALTGDGDGSVSGRTAADSASSTASSGASSADDPGESPSSPAKMNQQVTAAALDWTVTKAEKIDNHGQACNGLVTGRYVVAVTVDVVNAGSRTQDVPPFNMQYLRFKTGQPRFANCVTDPANGLPIKPGQPKRTLTYYFAMMPPQIAQIQQVELISEDSDAPHAFVALDDLGPSPAGWPPMNSSDKQIDDSFDLGGLTTKVTGAGAVDDPRCPGANYRVQVFARNENISAKPMPTAAGSPLKTSAGQVAGTCAFVGDIGTPAPTTIAPNQSVYLKLYYRVADPSTVQAVVIGGQVTVAIW